MRRDPSDLAAYGHAALGYAAWAAALLVALGGCDRRPDPRVKAEATRYELPAVGVISVREICHEGVVYLLTGDGGLSPKVTVGHIGDAFGGVDVMSPIRCTVEEEKKP